MKQLIFETSTEKGLILLADGSKLIAELPLPGGPLLSKTLALETEKLLTFFHFIPETIAFGKGPGSLTGIRVGATFARALALGWEIPVIEISSLPAFAPDTPFPFVVLVDGKMGTVYAWSPGEEPKRLSLAEALQEFEQVPLIASPHPILLQQKLPLKAPWIETSPNPRILLTQSLAQNPCLTLR